MAFDDDDDTGTMTLADGLKWGFGLIAVGIGLFLFLSLLESSSRGGRVHWFVAILYYVGGKWGAAAFCWFLGAVFIALGVRAHLRDRD